MKEIRIEKMANTRSFTIARPQEKVLRHLLY